MERVALVVQQAAGRLAASDPAHRRLRLALRGTLAVGGTVAAVAGLHALLRQPVLAAAPAVIVAMMGTLAVSDDSRRGRALTLLVGAAAAAGGVTLGAALAGATVAGRVVFVAAAGLAVLAQGLGPRGMVAGLLAFFAYFMALFVGVPLGSAWFSAIAVAAAAIVVLIVKELLIRDHPVRDLRRTIASFRQRAAAAGRAARALHEAGDDGPNGTRRRRLRRRVLELRETAMAITDELGDPQEEASARAHELVLQATLAAEELAEQAVAGARLDALRADLARLLDELGEVAPRAEPDRCGADEPDPGEPQEEVSDDEAERRERLPPHARKAAQATVAAGVAVPLGMLVSDQRWYWAALGAFVVFTRPATAAESVQRGAQRLVGTTAGAAAGIALGSAARGSTVAQVVLLVVAMFVTLYAFPFSYGVAMAGITTLLAVLYDLLGRFSDQLLELRVVETAIGVALGSLSAMLILPMSTRRRVREAEDDLLDELEVLLERARARDGAAGGLREQARAVERRAHELRDAAAPLTRPLPGMGSQRHRRRTVLLASLGRSAREIAATTPAQRNGDAAALRHDLDALLERLAAVRAGEDGGHPVELRLADEESPASRGLHRIGRVLDGLEEHPL